jgi:hypothetical protein
MIRFLRAFFHWSYSQFFIGGLFATGVAMLTYGHFVPAYVFFTMAEVWAMSYWQVSDWRVAQTSTFDFSGATSFAQQRVGIFPIHLQFPFPASELHLYFF